MKKLFYLCIFLVTLALAVASCKNDDDTKTPETPLISEGQIVSSEFSKDGVVIERMTDTVINFGSSGAPAFFYVNETHTLNGAPIAIGNNHGNVFRSVTRAELFDFIITWGQLYGMEVDPLDQSEEAIVIRQRAFHLLQAFLMSNGVDLPILIALGKDTVNLHAAVRITEAASANAFVKNGGVHNTAGALLRSLERQGVQPSALTKAIGAAGYDEKSFLALADQNGVDIGKYIREEASTDQEVIAIVGLVVKGVEVFSDLLIDMIEDGKPVVDIDNDFSSYLNTSDSLVTHYIANPTPSVSPTYSVAYCSLAKCSFYMEVYYQAQHQTLPGLYISRSGMIVKSVKCSWGMHVNGDITYSVGDNDGTQDNPVAKSNGEVTVDYGDCCCFARTATLDYTVNANTGYHEDMWDNGE
jgi:hypothetical protein